MYDLYQQQIHLGQFSDKIEALNAAKALGRIPLTLLKKGFEPNTNQSGLSTFWELRLVTTRIPETSPYALSENGQFETIEKSNLSNYHDVFEFCGAYSDGQDADFWQDLVTDNGYERTQYDFGLGNGNNKALFLDRDGVLIHDSHYPSDPEQIVVREDIAPVLIAAQEKGFQLIVVTNQSGVARGYFDLKAVESIHTHLQEYFKTLGIQLNHWFHCPYHEAGEEGPFQKISHYRKPYPGMFIQAARQHQLDLGQCLMIGDKLTDRPIALDLKTYFIHDPVKSSSILPSFYPDFATLLKDLPF
jgi:D-glycero-D-manno-heptose 1,7-bisphosphate phosphatase